MTVYYLDTSALVKRYASEIGTKWVLNLANPITGHDLYIIRVTGPEMIAALFRKVRMGEIDQNDALRAANNFKADLQKQYQIVEVDVKVIDRAMNLAEKHNLRGYDAVQLAGALELHELRQVMRLPILIFVSADKDQLQVAVLEGLLIDDPCQYP